MRKRTIDVKSLVRWTGILAIALCSAVAGAQEVRQELSSPIHQALSTAKVARPSWFTFLKPVPYTPFKYELPPGHPVDPNTKIVLPNHKTTTVREYIDSLNRIEKGLNQVGHTMRSQESHVLGPKYGDDALFKRQVDAYHASVAGKVTPWKSNLVAPTTSTTSSLALGGKVALRDDHVLDTWTPPQKGSTGSTNRLVSVRDFPNILQMINGTEQYFDKGFSGSFGDSNFGATLSAHMKVTGESTPSPSIGFSGAVSEMHGEADMSATAQIMGNSFNLLQFTARADGSDKANTRSYDLGLFVGGIQIFHDGDTSRGPLVQWQDGFSIDWDAQSPTFTFPLFGPFEMKGFVGVKGNAGVSGSFQVRSFSVNGAFAPYVTATAYGEITAGLDLGVASADVGVHADLVLLDDHLTFNLDAGLVWDPAHHFSAIENCVLENKLTTMSGSFSLVAHVYGPWGFKLYDWSTELAGWPGEYSDVVYSKPAMLKLNWH